MQDQNIFASSKNKYINIFKYITLIAMEETSVSSMVIKVIY